MTNSCQHFPKIFNFCKNFFLICYWGSAPLTDVIFELEMQNNVFATWSSASVHVPEMTYTLSGGMLNTAQSLAHLPPHFAGKAYSVPIDF